MANPYVLVVEDSRTQAARLKYILQKHGFEVGEAVNGRAALEMLAHRRPDLVVSDIIMPEIGGYELCRRIRASQEFHDLPVMLLTSLFEPSDVIEGLQCGANNLLTKPYREEALLSRMHQTLERDKARRSFLDGEGEITFRGKAYQLRFDPVQTTDFLLSTFEDAVERNVQLKESHAQVQEAFSRIALLETRYRNLIENSVEALIVVSPDGVVQYANRAAERLFGRDATLLVGEAFPFVLNQGVVEEIQIAQPAGKVVFAELQVMDTKWGDEDAVLASLRDVTETVRLREELRSLSLTDELTGLHNRRGFLTLAGHEVRLARRRQDEIIVLFADMDGLKAINDIYGHKAGDQAIQETAQVLKSTLRDSDIVARLGGDEFGMLPVFTAGMDPERIIERIQEAMRARNEKKTTPWELNVSIGSATCRSGDAHSLEELLEQADSVMYRKKEQRRTIRGVRRAGAPVEPAPLEAAAALRRKGS